MSDFAAKGRDLAKQGNFKQAIVFFNQDRNSDFPDEYIYNDLGHAYNKEGEYDEAIKCFNRILKDVDKKHVDSFFGKGISRLCKNEFSKAINCFNDAIKYDKNHADAWFYLAIIYANPYFDRFNVIEAQKCYDKFEDSRKLFYFLNDDNCYFENFNDITWDKNNMNKLRRYFRNRHKYYPFTNLFRFIELLLSSSNKRTLLVQFREFIQRGVDLEYINKALNNEDYTILNSATYDVNLLVADGVHNINELKDIASYVYSLRSVDFDDELINNFLQFNIGNNITDENIQNHIDLLKEIMLDFKNEGFSTDDINMFLKQKLYDNSVEDIFNFKNRLKRSLKRSLIRRNRHTSRENLIPEIENEICENNPELFSNQSSSCYNILCGIDYYDARDFISLINKELENDKLDKDILLNIKKLITDCFDDCFNNRWEDAFLKIQDKKYILSFMRLINNDKNYRYFIEGTVDSRLNNFKDAFEKYDIIFRTNNKIKSNNKDDGKKVKKVVLDENPIFWFNFANILCDYAKVLDISDNNVIDYAKKNKCSDKEAMKIVHKKFYESALTYYRKSLKCIKLDSNSNFFNYLDLNYSKEKNRLVNMLKYKIKLLEFINLYLDNELYGNFVFDDLSNFKSSLS